MDALSILRGGRGHHGADRRVTTPMAIDGLVMTDNAAISGPQGPGNQSGRACLFFSHYSIARALDIAVA